MRGNTMRYTAPKAVDYQIFSDVNAETNILIGGTTGSGKSTFINGMLYNLFNENVPDECEVYLIDPKRVALRKWTVMPHVQGYAIDAEQACTILDRVHDIMMDRYDDLSESGEEEYDGSAIYVFIDEMFMLIDESKEVMPKIKSLLRLCRAANIHVVCATQSASRFNIPAGLQVNFTCRVGLRTDDAIDSRQIVKVSGCEKLDRHGQCILKTPDGIVKRPVPMYTKKHIEAMRNYWMYMRMQKEVRA